MTFPHCHSFANLITISIHRNFSFACLYVVMEQTQKNIFSLLYSTTDAHTLNSFQVQPREANFSKTNAPFFMYIKHPARIKENEKGKPADESANLNALIVKNEKRK
ncbi:CLUMA_CG009733, isoform A [Clunio marinus]|uniref:CLUMA_CG009733, isoform A n=1 Tax=Clunio marinus TaxID=568069 RepID=A0A1J1I9A5_9DIPT|nr:CLUMA_CG009733, isoform A [Clunio marinus]